MTGVTLAFIPEPLSVSLDCLLPSRRYPANICGTGKFRKIESSIREVGLIEPLSVMPADKAVGQYVILDGHLRALALKGIGKNEAECLIATDDETYTYNNRRNGVSTIQEHYMIQRVIARGSPPERVAKALAMDVATVQQKLSILDGLCKEATELLANRQFSPAFARALRRMKPMRQVECVELMIAANKLTHRYAEALLVATPASALVDGLKPKRMQGISAQQAVRMEREMSNLQTQYKLVEQTYGQDVLHLVLAKGYLDKVLKNKPARQYLRQNHPDLLAEFEALVATIALDRQQIVAAA
ncbi:plasmid partitioning protein RepB C-terminal domain-containing protein [Paraburkholderia sp. BR10937]|uniref:plasmid partitioning protein RepB C-terminal domain-containing protein n=1 Tax=Paraburkholderia sp. BR10937 TaxID=3236994 RepID=UPI0034D2074E